MFIIFCIINAQAHLKFLTCTPWFPCGPSLSSMPINFIAKLDCLDRNQDMMGNTSLLDTETCLSSDIDPPPNKNLYCDWLQEKMFDVKTLQKMQTLSSITNDCEVTI